MRYPAKVEGTTLQRVQISKSLLNLFFMALRDDYNYSQEEIDHRADQLNPNNDDYWQSRGEDERPDDWQDRLED